jgi:diguanylate cyclase (GGDEF)-like protein
MYAGKLIPLGVAPMRVKIAWLAALAATGGVMGALDLVLPSWSTTAHRTLHVVLVVVSFSLAGLLWVLRDRAGVRALQASLVAGILVVTGFVWLQEPGAYLLGPAMFYGWGLSLAAAFNRPRAAARYVVFTAVVFAIALLAKWEPEMAMAWLKTMVALGVPALIISQLINRTEDLAAQDALTGLPNRRALATALNAECARATRDHTALAFAIVDLDNLKAVNDRDGHPAGDALITGAAAVWAAQTRGSDMLARIGGDEFALLMPECATPQQVLEVISRMRAAATHIRFSAGVALWQGEPTAELYARADSALYRAKRLGKNRVEVAPAPTGQLIDLTAPEGHGRADDASHDDTGVTAT